MLVVLPLLPVTLLPPPAGAPTLSLSLCKFYARLAGASRQLTPPPSNRDTCGRFADSLAVKPASLSELVPAGFGGKLGQSPGPACLCALPPFAALRDSESR
jgi:hypothetical protein